MNTFFVNSNGRKEYLVTNDDSQISRSVKFLLVIASMVLILLLAGCDHSGPAAQYSVRATHANLVLKPGEPDEIQLTANSRDIMPLDLGFAVNISGLRSTASVPCVIPSDTCQLFSLSAANNTPTRLLDEWSIFSDSVTGFSSSLPVTTFPSVTDTAAPAIRFAAGKEHSLAVLADGTVWAWGQNSRGQAGSDRLSAFTDYRPHPTQVSILQGFVAVAAGEAFSMALHLDGTVWTWGSNSDAQLGNGSDAGLLDYNPEPLQVVNLANIIAIAAGDEHSLALAADGTAWSWGRNFYGQLGYSIPFEQGEPTQVQNLSNIIAIEAGRAHSLALDSSGSVWAWGDNKFGQLGSGNDNRSARPIRVQLPGTVATIAAGGNTSYAVLENGTVWSWGANDSNQLGSQSAQSCSISTPCSLQAGEIRGIDQVLDIDAGDNFAIARRNDGSVWGWGSNASGQLAGIPGLGTLRPVQIQGLDNILAIVAGGEHALAMSADEACSVGDSRVGGRLVAWGSNISGSRGDGTGVNWFRPTPVLSLGDDSSCSSLSGHRIIVYKAGSGDGTIQSDQPGLTCSGMICWQSVAAGNNVMLTAMPDANSEFSDWRWDCTGHPQAMTIGMDSVKICKLRFNRVANNPLPPEPDPEPQPEPLACNDGIDNDDDGLVDLNDPGCSSAEDNSEINSNAAGDFTLTINITGSGEVFDNNDSSFFCFSDGTASCVQSYGANSQASLRGVSFDVEDVAIWTSGCDNGNGVQQACIVSMDRDRSVAITMQ